MIDPSTMATSVLSIAISLAAYIRSGRNSLEDQRERLLTQLTDLSVELSRRDSELVALLHRYARSPVEVQRLSADVVAAIELFRESLREQIAAFNTKHEDVAGAARSGLRKFLVHTRMDISRQIPLLAAQNQDIVEHIKASTERLSARSIATEG